MLQFMLPFFIELNVSVNTAQQVFLIQYISKQSRDCLGFLNKFEQINVIISI
jgi:hypothetical protein